MRRILVVDDDQPVRDMVVRVLTGEGYAALHADCSGRAMEILATTAVDLVLLDLGLPGKDGWDVLADLNRLQARPPVVIITAWPDQESAARAVGASALFEKPLDFPALLATVASLLAKPMGSGPGRIAAAARPS